LQRARVRVEFTRAQDRVPEPVHDQRQHGDPPDQRLWLAQHPADDQDHGQRQQRGHHVGPPDGQGQVRLVDIPVLDMGQFVQDDGFEGVGPPDRRDRSSAANGDKTTSRPTERERRQPGVERLEQPDHRVRAGPLARLLEAAHQVRVLGAGQFGQMLPPPRPPGLSQEDGGGHDEQHADAEQAPPRLGTFPGRVTHLGLAERVGQGDRTTRVLRQRLRPAPFHQGDQRRPARCGQVDGLVGQEARGRHGRDEQGEAETGADGKGEDGVAVPGGRHCGHHDHQLCQAPSQRGAPLRVLT
jgi:hypothetical protein